MRLIHDVVAQAGSDSRGCGVGGYPETDTGRPAANLIAAPEGGIARRAEQDAQRTLMIPRGLRHTHCDTLQHRRNPASSTAVAQALLRLVAREAAA